MRTQSREVSIFSVSALDIFASALGAFIVISMIFMVFFTLTSRDTGEDLRPALEQCEVGRTELAQQLRQCQSAVDDSVDASALEQCEVNLADARQGADRAGGALGECEGELRKTYVVVLTRWNKESDVDLHVVDPAGNEYYYERRTHAGSDAELDLDVTNGPGNEVWYHPRSGSGRYRICYKLYQDRDGGAPVTVHGRVLGKEGGVNLRSVVLRTEKEVRIAADVSVGRDGSLSVDSSQSGRLLGRRGCS